MNDNKYPWTMDKPIEEIESEVGMVRNAIPPRWELVDYLLDRLKIAEQNVQNTEYQYSLFRRGAELTHNEMVERLKIAEAERDEYKDRWLYDERNETF